MSDIENAGMSQWPKMSYAEAVGEQDHVPPHWEAGLGLHAELRGRFLEASAQMKAAAAELEARSRAVSELPEAEHASAHEDAALLYAVLGNYALRAKEAIASLERSTENLRRDQVTDDARHAELLEDIERKKKNVQTYEERAKAALGVIQRAV